jgi:hypothetical protein
MQSSHWQIDSRVEVVAAGLAYQMRLKGTSALPRPSFASDRDRTTCNDNQRDRPRSRERFVAVPHVDESDPFASYGYLFEPI